MSITVEELLHSEELPEIKLIAGYAGISNRIELTNVTDSEELHKWLSGSELILSNGLLFQHSPERLTAMVRALHAAGAAGMLIKLGRYIHEIPQETVAVAEELGFPLLTAPEAMPFSAVNRLLSRRASGLPQSAQRYAAFSALLEKEAGVPAYLRLLSGYLKADVVYYDNLSNKVFRSRWGCAVPEYDDDSMGAFLEENAAYPVRAGGNICGTLVVLRREGEPPAEELNALTIRYAVSMLGMTYQKLLPSRFQDAYWLERFLAELLRGGTEVSDDELRRRGRLCGFPFFAPAAAAVIEPADQRETAVRRVEELLTRELPRPEQTLLVRWERRMVLLWSRREGGGLRGLCEEAVRLCRQKNLSVSVGIGGVKNAPRQLWESYQEALRAMAVGVCFSGPGVYDSENLGCAGFLYAYAGTAEAEAAVEEVLGRLRQYDERKPSYALLPTLRTIARCGFNLTQAAEELYIHYNTLKYRYTKICEITGLELSKFENQAKVFLALSLLQARQGVAGDG